MTNVSSIAFWRQNLATDLPPIPVIETSENFPPRFSPTKFSIRIAFWQNSAQDIYKKKEDCYELNTWVIIYNDPAVLWI